jgi:hypothetical protein
MLSFGKVVSLCAVIGLVQPGQLAAEPQDQSAKGSVSIYNLDSEQRFAKIAIDGPIDKAVATRALELIRFFRPKVGVVTVVLNSQGGDVLTAMEIGEEIRKQWVLTEMDDIAAPDKVGIHRPYFDPKLFASLPPDQARQKYDVLAKAVQVYLSRMGMPDQLFQEMMRQPSNEILFLNADRLESLGLAGWDAAYQEWVRAKNSQNRHNQTETRPLPS